MKQHCNNLQVQTQWSSHMCMPNSQLLSCIDMGSQDSMQRLAHDNSISRHQLQHNRVLLVHKALRSAYEETPERAHRTLRSAVSVSPLSA